MRQSKQIYSNESSLNFAELDEFGNLTTIFGRDIFVLNFVISEVFGLDELLPIMQKMVSGCRGGAHFLFIDRSDDATADKVEKLITNLQLEVKVRAETKGSMDTDGRRLSCRKYPNSSKASSHGLLGMQSGCWRSSQ